MNQLVTKTTLTAPLSVSYRSSVIANSTLHQQPEAVFITNLHFIIKGVNEAAHGMFGFTAKDAKGMQLFDLLDLEMTGYSLEDVIEGLQVNQSWQGDMLYNDGNRKILYNTKCNIISDEEGNASSIVIAIQNLSDVSKKDIELEEAEYRYQTLVESLSEGVILFNREGAIVTSNSKAAEMFGTNKEDIKKAASTSADWTSFKEDGSIFPEAELPVVISMREGREMNNVLMYMKHVSGKGLWISVNSRPIFENGVIEGVVVSMFDVSDIKNVNHRLENSEELFRTFMKNSPALGWIYDEDGMLIYGNPRFLNTVGLPEEYGNPHMSSFTSHTQALTMLLDRNRAVLESGQPLITEDELPDKNGEMRNYISYWFALPISGGKKLIGGHSVEITDTKKVRREIDKMYERYTFAANASSDAIWDMDITTNEIYRSETFAAFSGYKKEEIGNNLEWFIEKIHPLDRKRIKSNVENCLKKNVTHWENEYRFQVADGSFRHLLDKAYAIYENGKLIRVIGAMQDMTERKMLEAQLLNEQVQKQKMVNQAIIQAQDKERNRISGELHDNVNQLLMSAKLHICVAKTRAEGETELLDKATQYLLMAVEEIRGLSKKMNSSVMYNVGLLKSIGDIGETMRLMKNIHLHTYIHDDVVEQLTPEQQMMVYRIIQEQTSNIIKYADTHEAIISLKKINSNFELIISDNGQGFDKKERKTNGIGFINIFNRIESYNGKMEIITSPGNGCTLLINFPEGATEKK